MEADGTVTAAEDVAYNIMLQDYRFADGKYGTAA